MIRTTLCLLIGHRPQVYDYTKNDGTIVYYVGCARCGRRKDPDGPGWKW